MTKTLAGAMVLAALLSFVSEALAPPALAETAATPIQIAQATTDIRLVGKRPPGPGERALPKAGERLTVEVPAGAIVKFVDDAFKPSSTRLNAVGDDLELTFEDGGVLVLRSFLAEPPAGMDFAALELAGGIVIQANQIKSQLEAIAPLETAAGAAAGGGELFGMVQVVSWLLDRIDLMGRAEAAEATAEDASGKSGTVSINIAPPSADDSILDQLMAQMLIARNGEIAAAAADYRATTDQLLAAVKAREKGGGGSPSETVQAETFNINAVLEEEEAAFALILAIDAHQDRFAERLETAAYRPWPTNPPTELAAILAQVGPERRAAARRYWRQMKFAKKTFTMLEHLETTSQELFSAYSQQYEVAQRSLTEVHSALELVYRVLVRKAQREHELKTAEAWLLAATGPLPSSVILRPGWQ